MKKILSISLSIILIFSLSLPTFARVSSNDTGDVLYWDGNTDNLEYLDDGLLKSYRVWDNADFLKTVTQVSLFIHNGIDGGTSYLNLDDAIEISVQDPVYIYTFFVGNFYYPVMFVTEDVFFDEITLLKGIYFPNQGYIETYGSYSYVDMYVTEFRAFGYTGFKTEDSSTDTPVEPDTSTTETIVVKEDRPFFTTPLTEYTVTEGLLLLLFVITFLNNTFKQHLKGN